jgi:hypothetical protein
MTRRVLAEKCDPSTSPTHLSSSCLAPTCLSGAHHSHLVQLLSPLARCRPRLSATCKAVPLSPCHATSHHWSPVGPGASSIAEVVAATAPSNPDNPNLTAARRLPTDDTSTSLPSHHTACPTTTLCLWILRHPRCPHLSSTPIRLPHLEFKIWTLL